VGSGPLLDLWVVPVDSAGNLTSAPQLIDSSLAVAAVSTQSDSFSSQVPITFFAYPNQVSEILNAINLGKIYVVRK
jgi:hypothetical protein